MRSALRAYGFVHAKLKARLSKRLPPETIDRLIKARSLPEAVQFLKGTDYEPLLKAYTETGDLSLAEAALYAREVAAYAELYRFLDEPMLSFVKALALRYEIEQVKSATRLWFDATVRGRSIDGKSGYVYRGVIAHSLDIDAIVRSPDAESLARALGSSPYAAMARRELPGVVAARSLLRFELSLDRFFYDEAFGAAARLWPADRKVAERSLSIDVDAQNMARAARHGVSRADRPAVAGTGMPGGAGTEATLGDYLLPYGTAYRRLAKAGGDGPRGSSPAASIGEVPERGARGEPLRRAALLEAAARGAVAAEAGRNLAGYPFSIGVVVAYFERRQEECRAVMTALNAKRYALPEERIRSFL